MAILLRLRRSFCLLLTLALLSGCDRTPDCDSKSAQELIRITVYTLVKNALREKRTTDDDSEQKPLAWQMHHRQQALIDMYHPQAAIANDAKWLRSRLKAGAPDLFKGESFATYLMLNNYKVIREAVSVNLAEYEPLPDRVKGERTYKNVCRAKLTIIPNNQSSKKFESIQLTYSVNSPPRGSRTSSASPLYVPVNLFEVTEPPLPFSLSDSEKLALMALGAVKDIRAVPRPQSPQTRVTRMALRALRSYIESEEATHAEAPNPSSGRKPPGKPASASHTER